MNSETERILGTLEILTEKYLYFDLPNNETSSLVPFVWDVNQKGDFNLLRLGRDEGWIIQTDIDIAVKNWQQLERHGYLNPDDDPGDYEKDIINPELADEREKTYQELVNLIQENLHNIEVLKLSQIPMYSFYVVLGQNQENNWFCLSQTVARETRLEGEIKCSVLPDLIIQQYLDSNTVKLQEKFQQIINQLKPISIYGYYGGGYDYRFNHYLVQGIANTKEKALLIALQQAGMLDIAKFHEFNPEALSWRWDKDEIAEFTPRYQKLNQFLNQNLADLKMIRCSFCNRECIYIVGQTNTKNLAGIYIESDFNYNP